MNSFGARRNWQNHPPGAQPDLARMAVIGGGLLTLVLVVLASATGLWGSGAPAPDPPVATSSAAALGTDLEPAGKSDSGTSDGDSHSGKSDSGKPGKSDKDKSTSKSDSGKDGSKDSGKSAKKHGSSSVSSSSYSEGSGVLAGLGDAFSPSGAGSGAGGSSSRVLPPNFSVPTRRSPAALGRAPGVGAGTASVPSFDGDYDSYSDSGEGSGAEPGVADRSDRASNAAGGYPRSASGSLTCTKVVGDRAGLDRELRNAGPDEVVCMRAGATAGSDVGGLGGGSRGLPGGFGGATADAGRTSPYVARSGSRGTSSYVGPGQSSGNISLGSGSGSGSGSDGRCTQEVTDSAGFERALKGARDGDKVCIGVGDLGIRLEVGKGGTSGLSIQIAGLGALSSKGIKIQTDDVQAEHNNIGRITTK